MKQYSRRMVSGLLLVVGGLFVALILPEIVPAAVVALIPVGVALVVGGGALATSAGRVQAEIDALPPHILERQISPERLIANAIFVVGLIAFAAVGICLLSSLVLWPLLVVFGAVGLIGGVAALLLYYRDQGSTVTDDAQSSSSTPFPSQPPSSTGKVVADFMLNAQVLNPRVLEEELEPGSEPEVVPPLPRSYMMLRPKPKGEEIPPPLAIDNTVGSTSAAADPLRSASSPPDLQVQGNRKTPSS